MTGKAGGGGYCKLSAAFADALYRQGVEHGDISGVGESAMQDWLEAEGYQVIRVI